MVLKLIKTEKGYIAIDDKPIPYIADGGTNGHFLCLSELDYGFDEAYVLNVGDCGGCRKIVATDTTFKIDGIPQFELEKHINPYQEICDKLINPLDALSFEIEHPLIEQMKLVLHDFRQKSLEQKKYTEEDLRIVFGLGAANNANGKPSFEETIQSLKELKSIEVEVEEVCRLMSIDIVEKEGWSLLEGHKNTYIRPKLIDNKLVVTKFFY